MTNLLGIQFLLILFFLPVSNFANWLMNTELVMLGFFINLSYLVLFIVVPVLVFKELKDEAKQNEAKQNEAK